MMPPHSTQRTLPALCSSCETQSEIRRLWVQSQSGVIGSGGAIRPDSSRFIVHLSSGKEDLLADLHYRNSLISAKQGIKYGTLSDVAPAETDVDRQAAWLKATSARLTLHPREHSLSSGSRRTGRGFHEARATVQRLLVEEAQPSAVVDRACDGPFGRE